MAMAPNVRAALAYVARKEAPLGIVYATDANVGGVKVVGVFPENSHNPIIYPVAATVNAKPETMQYLAFLRSAAAKSKFESYGLGAGAKVLFGGSGNTISLQPISLQGSVSLNLALGVAGLTLTWVP